MRKTTRATKANKPLAGRVCFTVYVSIIAAFALSINAYAVDDVFTVANKVIVNVYNSIAGISTVLAGLMTAVSVIGAKMSNTQQKTDQAWDWSATRS